MFADLIGLDAEVFLWINRGWSNPVLDAVSPWLTHLGGGTAGYVFVLAVYAFTRDGRAFFTAGAAYALNAAVFKAVKYSVLRVRPHHLPDAILRMDPGLSGATDPSFPSGHAAISCMIAVFLSARWPRLAPVFYTVAALVSLSRIYLGLHYPSDVLCGAAIGIGVARLTLTVARRRKWLTKWSPSKNANSSLTFTRSLR